MNCGPESLGHIGTGQSQPQEYVRGDHFRNQGQQVQKPRADELFSSESRTKVSNKGRKEVRESGRGGAGWSAGPSLGNTVVLGAIDYI